MDEQIQKALENDLTIDITTKGRKSGKPRKIEIWFHNVDGVLYITGTPGTRDWYANMLAEPEFTFHLKESVKADLPARATPITDSPERKCILTRMRELEGRDWDLTEWLKDSPLVEVTLENA
ncbi:MAG: nitroreductase/quinone reductase family protein [Chloroflexi bacterium]|nr:nitroreductase/quinone reductase family protein [Chloroflexota bacterium]